MIWSKYFRDCDIPSENPQSNSRPIACHLVGSIIIADGGKEGTGVSVAIDQYLTDEADRLQVRKLSTNTFFRIIDRYGTSTFSVNLMKRVCKIRL